MLVEPLVSGSPYAEVLRRAGSGDPDTVAVTVATVYSCASTESAPGHARTATVARLAFDERGGIVHDGLSDETVARLEREVRMPASDVVTSAARIRDIVDVEGRVLIETLLPPVPLVVFGAGQDMLPLVRLARGLG